MRSMSAVTVEQIQHLLDIANFYLWHPAFMASVLVLTGLYVTVRLVAPQARLFGRAWSILFRKRGDGDAKGLTTHLGALSTALSGTAGIGAVAGVAMAIRLGGPGAVFWLWIGGLLAMAAKTAEAALAMAYRRILPDGTVLGGPMITMADALNKRWRPMAFVFAALCALAAALGVGNMVQSGTMAAHAADVLGIPRWATGLAMAALVGAVTLGGFRRIARVTSGLLPLALLVYAAGAIAAVAMNAGAVPEALRRIFTGALSGSAAAGGLIGAGVMEAVRYGLARGASGGECWLGASSTAHAAARSEPPVRQGFVALLEPFLHTFVFCTLTALVILTSGAWTQKSKGRLPIDAVRVYAGAVESPADAADRSRLLSGLIRISEGILEGGVIFLHEGSIIESPSFFLEGKPFSGSIEIRQGRVSGGTLFDPGKGQGAAGMDMPHHVPASLQQILAITMTGYYCPTGAALSARAFHSTLGIAGTVLVTLALLLLGLCAMVAWSHFGDRSVAFLIGERAVLPYRLIFVALTFAGAVSSLGVVWGVAGVLSALLLLPNVLSLWLLGGVARDLTWKYTVKEAGSSRSHTPWKRKK